MLSVSISSTGGETMSKKAVLTLCGLVLLLAIGCSFLPESNVPSEVASSPTLFMAPTKTPLGMEPTQMPLGVESLSGTYEGGGTNPDGSAYRVQVAVAEQVGYYTLTWSNGTSGYGLRNGNILAASFGGDQCAIVLYTIASDYSLRGNWLTFRQAAGTEDATPKVSRNALEGDFDINGVNPDGSSYHGTMSLTPHGDLWRAVWYAPNETQGIGVVLENTLAITYGNDRCGVVSYRITADGTLDGIWGWWSTTNMGTEKISR